MNIALLSKSKIRNIDIILLSLIFVELVIYPDIVGLTVIAYFLFLIILKKLNTEYSSSKISILLCVFYLLHVISLIWTYDIDKGLFDLEVKLSLFAFPLIIGYMNLSKNDIEKIFVNLANVWLMVNLFLLVRSILNYFSNHQILSYTDFTYKSHPTYFSMYSIFFISYYILKKGKITKQNLFYILIFVLGVLLSSSKSGFIGLVILTFVYFFTHYKKIAILLSVSVLVIIYYLFYKTNYLIFISDRIKTSQEIITKLMNKENLPIETNTIRLYAWKTSTEVISDHWLIGTGIGDTHNTLNQYYIQKHLFLLAEKNINAHNVFLQVTLSLGILGLSLFLIIIFMLIYQAHKNKSMFISIYLIILILLYFSTESILETQAGTVFIGLFFSLFDKYLKL